jgi:hypothetical protein
VVSSGDGEIVLTGDLNWTVPAVDFGRQGLSMLTYLDNCNIDVRATGWDRLVAASRCWLLWLSSLRAINMLLLHSQ